MGFFRRLFSADYRAAVAAEAGGDLELAAERYALAGQKDAAVRVHLARADRAPSRKGEIAALRDALHWSDESAELRGRVSKRLGRALLARARAEGVATERDRNRVREAAALLAAGGEHALAGEAYESIDDDVAAADAYRVGGLVDRMEDALLREQKRTDEAREVTEAYADYEVAIRGGERDAAIRALRRSVAAAESKTEYRRMLDELEARLIAGGVVTLALRKRGRVTVFSGERLLIGRDSLCDFVLRSAGISRQHAEIIFEGSGDELSLLLADAGSKNGTRVGGIAVTGSVPLVDTGSFDLGDHCSVNYEVSDPPRILTLTVDRGVDRGNALRAAEAGTLIDLEDLGIPAKLYLRDGRPMLKHPGADVVLAGYRIARGDVQLVHGDSVAIAGVELEVL